MPHHPHLPWMKRAIASARAGMRRGEGGPFGACLVRKGRILAVAHNTVLKERDATCHAEMNAIRAASGRLEKYDLSDTVLYSTTEPCPMCFSAIHWARIPVVYFGTSIADVARRGFNELKLSNAAIRRASGSRVRSVSGIDRESCRKLLEEWDRLDKRQTY